jgi:hypothetical protein
MRAPGDGERQLRFRLAARRVWFGFCVSLVRVVSSEQGGSRCPAYSCRAARSHAPNNGIPWRPVRGPAGRTAPMLPDPREIG